MRKAYMIIIYFVILSFYSCNSKNEIKVYNFSEFESYLYKKDNKIHIIHFWATWCIPCIKELPEFTKFYEENRSGKMDMILVSLDFAENAERELILFIEEYNITPRVIVLDDPDQNYWINEVDPKWGGSIPATLVYSKERRDFFEKSLTYSDLVSIVKPGY